MKTAATDIYYAGRVQSPLGDLNAFLIGDHLAEIRIKLHRPGRTEPPAQITGGIAFDAVREQLEAYFRGELLAFALPLATPGTAFDLKVWAAVRAVPFGVTVSYSEIARRIGHAGAARAVGTSNARNPLMVVTPCHRVVTADGRLAGQGTGRAVRRWLLEHEGVNVRNNRVKAGSEII